MHLFWDMRTCLPSVFYSQYMVHSNNKCGVLKIDRVSLWSVFKTIGTTLLRLMFEAFVLDSKILCNIWNSILRYEVSIFTATVLRSILLNTETIAGLWRKTSAGKSCIITFVMNWHVCNMRLVSKLLFRASSTAARTPLSEVTNACHGITNHLIPPSVVFDIGVPSPHSNVKSNGIVL